MTSGEHQEADFQKYVNWVTKRLAKHYKKVDARWPKQASFRDIKEEIDAQFKERKLIIVALFGENVKMLLEENNRWKKRLFLEKVRIFGMALTECGHVRSRETNRGLRGKLCADCIVFRLRLQADIKNAKNREKRKLKLTNPDWRKLPRKRGFI